MARPGQPPRRYPRTARVNEVVLETLAEELERLSDPRLGFVTLTGVEVSPDLRQATVYYSVLGHQVRLKYLPRLSFREDPAITTGQRVEDIIRELHRQEEQ